MHNTLILADIPKACFDNLPFSWLIYGLPEFYMMRGEIANSGQV